MQHAGYVIKQPDLVLFSRERHPGTAEVSNWPSALMQFRQMLCDSREVTASVQRGLIESYNEIALEFLNVEHRAPRVQRFPPT
jgi:hypothetical protein